MTSSRERTGEKIRNVRFGPDSLVVDLVDGRSISVPLEWYPRLTSATAAQRSNWKLSAAGHGIHWPDIDEDLSSEGLLAGAPSPEFRGRAPTGG